jgi:hypothetical protein
MKLATTPEEQRAWMAQWRLAAVELERVKVEELRAMTEEKAAWIANEVLPETDDFESAVRLRPVTGLVEQQRLFTSGRLET